MSQNNDDEEFGDFGDFQTCQRADISLSHPQVNSDNIVSSKVEDVNIFERDPSQFDNVLKDFDHTINELFPLINERHKPTVIHSQEDSITDCPFWWNLSGNFKNFQNIPFKKTKSFDLFLSALRSAASFSDNYNDNNNRIIVDNNHDFNDEDLASELDMHSLILDSSTNSIQKPGDETINADKIIEEIENIMKVDSDENDDEFQQSEKAQVNDVDDLVGLNASSLLNAALDSWTKYKDLFSDEDDNEDDHNEFRSLPVTMSSPSDPPTEASFYPSKIRPSVTINSLESSQGSTNTSEMSSSTYDRSNNTFAERIQQLSIVKLNELLMEMERIIQIKSEILIRELAIREEAENEKELKNNFISSLLNVQNKRRLLSSSKNKKPDGKNRNKLVRRKSDVVSGSSNFLSSRFVPNFSTLKETFGLNNLQGGRNPSAADSIYLTTIIPYNPEKSCLDNSTLEMLIKLLDAMNENSPTVPQLLTDYILKVICM